MKTLIFGDVHLKVGASNTALRNDFVAFLRSIDPSEVERIVILGDLFDFWFEYRHVAFSGYFEVLRALADLRDAGVVMHLVCGNHDFWAGRFFEADLGISVHRDGYRHTLGGTRGLFVHGDGLNPSDRGYRVYKRIARSRVAIGLFGLLHPDWAMAIAQRVSHGSRSFMGPADPGESREVKAMRAYAAGVLERDEADLVVCGHTHFPVEETIARSQGEGRYINTGGWLEHQTFLLWDAQGVARYVGRYDARRRVDASGLQEKQNLAVGADDVSDREADQAH